MKKFKKIFVPFLLLSFLISNISDYYHFSNSTPSNNDTTNYLEEINNLEPSIIDCQPLKFEWVKYWSSSGDHDRCFGSYMDSDDNIYLTGYQNFGGGDLRLVLVKYDKDGNLLFTSNWGTSGNDQHTGYDVVLDSLGNIYCAGIWRKDPDDWNEDFILVKFDSSGNHLWTRQWGGGGKEKCYAIACDSQDNLYLTGSTTAYEGEVVTLKYDSSGNLIWERFWGGTYHESGFALTIDSSDNIYVGGYTYTTDASNDMVVIKYDSDGNELLNFTWGTPQVDWGYAVEFDSENNFYLAGRADNKVCLIKYNSTLHYQWHTTEGGSGDPKSIDFDSNDDIYLGGYTSGFGAYYSDFYLLKFDSSGNFHYRQLRNQAVDYAYAVHIDSNDDIYLTGSTYSSTTYSRMMMVKYTEPPCISIISPEPYSIFNATAPEFNVSIYEPHLDMSWYSLNNGQNHTFLGNIGIISQTAWDLCEDGTITLRFYANDSIGKLGSNLIYLWKDFNYPESATPDLSYLICWDENGVPISTAEQRQVLVRICSDGNGGTIMAWQDERRWSEQDIYVQKVNATGDIQWTIDGLVLCYMTYSDSAYHPEICPDGKGGAIVTWKDFRDSGAGVFAQKVDSDGNIKWTQNGVVIRISSSLREPEICEDGKGGAFITWQDSSTDRIYAQHINSEGLLQWGSSGVAISSVNANYLYDMCIDQQGGFIISWVTQGGNVYAQKLSSSGSRLWGSNGVPICLKPDNSYYPKICYDGNGGAIITWFHGPFYESERNIYAQRVNSTGVVQWEIDGLPICTIPSPQTYPQIIYDGDGGAIMTWEDSRNSDTDIYAQRVNSQGEILWVRDGFPICNEPGTQSQPQLCSDGENGAIVTWTDSRNGNADIYTQRLGPKGYTLWEPNGVAICNETGNQNYAQICNYSNNGAIVVWQDTRLSANCDLFVQKIRKDNPEIFIQNPISNGIYGNISPDFKLYIEEYNVNYTWYRLNNRSNYSFTGDSGKINQEEWDACGNGTVTITFYVNNSKGKLGKKHVVVRKDIINPMITILSPMENELFGNSTFNFEIFINEPHLDHTWYTLNGGQPYFFTGFTGIINQEAWEACGNGTVTISFYANDSVGNWAFEEVIVRKDTHFPNIVIYSPKEYQICGIATIKYELSIDDPNLDTIWYTLNEGPSYFFTSFSGNISQEAWDACGNGTVTIRFYANNTIGNLMYEEIIVHKNIYSPYIDIISPISNQLFGNTSIDFELYVYDPYLDITWYTLNGGKAYFFTGFTGTISSEALDECTTEDISIIFYANNTAGNIAFEEVIIQRDVSSPEVTILSPVAYEIYGWSSFFFEVSITDPNLEITWYTLNGGSSYIFTGFTGTINQEAWDACGNGTVIIRFLANDSLGNWAYEEVIVRKDIYEPIISIISPTPSQLFGDETVDFELSIDEPNLDTTWYTLNESSSYFFTGTVGSIDQNLWNSFGNGIILIRFYAEDSVGNLAIEAVSVLKDSDAPDILILNPLNNDFYSNNAPNFTVIITDNYLHSMWYILNNTGKVTFSSNGTIDQDKWNLINDGNVLIEFFANDTIGNLRSSSIIVIKDTIDPLLIINQPKNNDLFGVEAPNFNIRAQDIHLDSLMYSLDGGLSYKRIFNNASFDQNKWDKLSNGTTVILFYANDSASNEVYQSVSIFVKKYVPSIIINSPLPNRRFGTTIPIFNIWVNNSDDTLWYSYDNGITKIIFTENGTLLGWESLNDGYITITFFANDTAGNWINADVTIIKDTEDPIISIISQNNVIFNEDSPSIELEIIDNSTIIAMWYSINHGLYQFNFTETIFKINQSVWATLPESEITITFYAMDEVGNLGSTSIIVTKQMPSKDSREMIPGYDLFLIFGFLILLTYILATKIRKLNNIK